MTEEEKKIVEFEEKKFCGHVIRQRMSDGYLNGIEKNFKVDIRDMTYFIDFKTEDTIFKKPLNISITRYHICTSWNVSKEYITILEKKRYYRIRRRIYNNIVCINKLKDGSVRKYQIINELELETLKKYLIDKNILFKIVEKSISYIKTYDVSKIEYMSCFSYNRYDYPEDNKVYKYKRLYVEVYKGYVNI